MIIKKGNKREIKGEKVERVKVDYKERKIIIKTRSSSKL